MNCEICEGEGKVPVLNCDLTIDLPAGKGGEVHHYEECDNCKGSGEEPDCENCKDNKHCPYPIEVCGDWEYKP